MSDPKDDLKARYRKVAYYPGCALEGTAHAYNVSTRAVGKALGLELEEVADWNCCGAMEVKNVDPKLQTYLSSRVLAIAAQEMKAEVVMAPCNGCYHNLKKAEYDLAHDPKSVEVVDRLSKKAGHATYQAGQVETIHALDWIKHGIGEEGLRSRVKKSLSGLKVANYYGCMYTRPRHIFPEKDQGPGSESTLKPHFMDDLLDAAGKQPPKTIPEYAAMAKEMNSPMRAGTISCLKPVDAGLNEAHWYMNAIGDGWFDAQNKPIFNDAKGVEAIETLKTVTASAQRGFAAAANDECALAFQQDLAVMGLQWATRAASMDDAAKSRVVGKIDWAPAPGGHARLSGDGYAISAFSKQDPDLLFRIIAFSSNKENMREAAALTVPPRQSVLRDPELAKKFRHYPAVLASLDTAVSFPRLPEFYEVGEFITRRVLQAVNGEMETKAALDEAAKETAALLKSRGYD